MTTLEDIDARLARIESAQKKLLSPYLRGDDEAANYAGYRTRKAFRAWAKASGVSPSIDGGLNFWKRADIDKARERGKR